MKCKDGTKRLLTAVLIGIFVFGFTVSSVDEIFLEMWQQDFGLNCSTFEQETHKLNQPSSVFINSTQEETASNPLGYLFQFLFILFLISPPLIVIMLCLIWKELKKRNELK